jgi:hypothetical protein
MIRTKRLREPFDHEMDHLKRICLPSHEDDVSLDCDTGMELVDRNENENENENEENFPELYLPAHHKRYLAVDSLIDDLIRKSRRPTYEQSSVALTIPPSSDVFIPSSIGPHPGTDMRLRTRPRHCSSSNWPLAYPPSQDERTHREWFESHDDESDEDLCSPTSEYISPSFNSVTNTPYTSQRSSSPMGIVSTEDGSSDDCEDIVV